MALHVGNSPFQEDQIKLVNELLSTLTDYQKIWLTGYFSATQALAVPQSEGAETVKLATKTERQAATILFGSQTGNAQGLAEKLAAKLRVSNVDVTISAMSAFKTNALKKLTNLFIVTSTHGEGEPPDNAIQLHEFLYSKRAPKLEQVKFSVLALGDSSYEFFCKTGLDFDEQLEKLGAQRIVPRVDCDLDDDEQAEKWLEDVTNTLTSLAGSSVQPVQQEVQIAQVETSYSKKNPFYAEVLANINLNGRGSNKETRHLELSLEGSGLTYEPGDSIGILPQNAPELVDQLLEALTFDGNEEVLVQEEHLTLKEALLNKLEITVLSKPLLQKIANYTANEALATLIASDDAWKEFSYGRDLVDVVHKFGPFTWSSQQFVELLRKIPVRLYSIASSQLANEEEVHLTIGKVSYETDGRERGGVCSNQVAARLEEGARVPVYVHKNPNFKLPKDPTTPIIMIGAGTGIAPFRSFVEERAERGDTGKAWLFFGDQHFMTDFLYQTEWKRWLQDGTLTELSVAFSRDTEQKVYVQHRLQENVHELYKWLQEGAVVYVCGDKKTLAVGVDQTLQTIVEQAGNKTQQEAEQYVQSLRAQQRYQRDVY
ncbi:assimilatory sulfite reductase (NADPH) flavoprotein subunit [Solibacillus sp. FSL H8-0523]|uniref:assimilatory sulfite reductase (NADPH) flavoprotein subunit n=1 Tax=unclassified Solibacillus TaxID=2637870 RepID=UPI0031019DE5